MGKGISDQETAVLRERLALKEARRAIKALHPSTARYKKTMKGIVDSDRTNHA